MIEFLLNEQGVTTRAPAGTPLLDFLRYRQGLTGAKAGCREGDCGACVVLCGELTQGRLRYRPVTSCLLPLGKAHGCHILTVEALGDELRSPVQAAIAANDAVQCGFCTPGIVLSLTAACLSEQRLTEAVLTDALGGHLCRCTGYLSLRRAVAQLATVLPAQPEDRPLEWLISQGYLPAWMTGIPERLARIPARQDLHAGPLIAGGTDLMVQRPDELARAQLQFFPPRPELRRIEVSPAAITIGAAATIHDIFQDEALRSCLPALTAYESLIASAPIRQLGTLGGNLANASPIADLAILFLALDATVLLAGPSGDRQLPLRKFFIDYKRIDLRPEEYIAGLRLAPPSPLARFHFEKVSKRRHLDIASVNTALSVELNGERIVAVHLSAGGVAPVPLYLAKTVACLQGKVLSEPVLQQAATVLQSEISPISDIRGSANYKRLLLRQLFFAHWLELFPDRFSPQVLLPQNELIYDHH